MRFDGASPFIEAVFFEKRMVREAVMEMIDQHETDDMEQKTNDLKEKLGQLKQKLASERPVKWKEFPDIGLYKDQVVSYMNRQLINFEEGGQLTSAMVNNYIKDGLLPRADGKKYSREHLAGLTEICLLKQVLSVKDTGFLLKYVQKGKDNETFYTNFIEVLDRALADTAGRLDAEWNMEALPDMALKLAISSYCDKLACERLIRIMQQAEEQEIQKKPDKKHDRRQESKAGSKAGPEADKTADKKEIEKTDQRPGQNSGKKRSV